MIIKCRGGGGEWRGVGRNGQVKNLLPFSRFKYIILFSSVFTVKTFLANTALLPELSD